MNKKSNMNEKSNMYASDDSADIKEINKLLKMMTLEEKVGQLFALSAYAAELDADTRRIIRDVKPGGLFLGTHCLNNPSQVQQLTSQMQQLSMEKGSGQPLFISADFVAGAGCKLKEGGATHFPKNRAIGQGGDEHLAYLSGKVTAEESLAMGVNFNYSPVADINNNPLNPVIGTHSFGEDAELVSRMTQAVVKGYQEHGMIATAKHFPGHGDTSVDSHEDLPVLTFERERLQRFEFVPFARAIEADVDAVMVGHIAVPELDDSMTPASLSKAITTGWLREQLKFDGLIVTDGLTMKGVTNKYSLEEACILAILAGADILLATAEHADHAVSIFHAVMEAVRQGRISQARIEESAVRILQMKQKYQLTAPLYRSTSPISSDQDGLKNEEAKKISLELARQALTVKNGELPLKALQQENDLHLVQHPFLSLFSDQVGGSYKHAKRTIVETQEELPEMLAGLPSNCGLVLAWAHNKPLGKAFIESLQLGRFRTVAWVHFGSEYDVAHSKVPCLLLYDHAPSLQEAAAEVVTNVQEIPPFSSANDRENDIE